MLIDFAVENFKSFDSLARLNMVATRETDHRDHCLPLVGTKGNTRVNKFAALFGPNAGGKSNLLKALLTMRKMVLECGIRQVGSDEKSAPRLPYSPFSLDKERCQAPTLFQAMYEFGGRCFRYGFTYNAEEILSEWLYTGFAKNEELVFEREGLIVTEGALGAGFATEAEKFLNSQSLVLSICYQAKHSLAQEASAFFIEICFGEEFEKTKLGRLLFDSPFLPVITAMLQFADTGIADVKVFEANPLNAILPSDMSSKALVAQAESAKSADGINKSEENSVIDFFSNLIVGKITTLLFKEDKQIQFFHSTYNPDVESEKCRLGEEDESRGTLSFIRLLYMFCQAMTKNALVVLDEIEIGLHPLLVRGLLEFMAQVEGPSTQIIFTTHCTPLFDSEILRRDELWLVEKEDSGRSVLLCTADYKKDARPDANLMRRFIDGRFGGLPLLQEKILKEGTVLASAIVAQARQQQMKAQMEQIINSTQSTSQTNNLADNTVQGKSTPQANTKKGVMNGANQSKGKAHGN